MPFYITILTAVLILVILGTFQTGRYIGGMFPPIEVGKKGRDNLVNFIKFSI